MSLARGRFLLLVVVGCGRIAFTEEAFVDGAVDTEGDCPGVHGPAMARVPGGFCMDTTEVTAAQYDGFLQALEPVKHDSACTFNTTYAVLDYVRNATTDPDQAVAGIDWCDARDYCTWAGKRLCGAIGGGSLGYDEYATPTSQWYFACSQGIGLDHPYGTALDDTVQPGHCYLDAPLDTVGAQAVVGSYPRCALADTGVYDLLGNLEEWIDACEPDGADPAETRCRAIGGVWYFGSSYSTCAFADPSGGMGVMRSLASKAIGFRCCAD